MLYHVGDHVLMTPRTIALGFGARGIIEGICEAETFPYYIRFSDGLLCKFHESQIHSRAGTAYELG